MPIVWCSISAHGYGHAAQVIPILNELGKGIEALSVILRTCVPSSIFEQYLRVPWEIQAVPQDIGCIQQGPLDIDIEGTLAAYKKFHENWNTRVTEEVQAMSMMRPNLVISNISYLSIASASRANLPVVALASLSWDQVIEPFLDSSKADHRVIIEHMQNEYSKANHLIRLNPKIAMPAFGSITDTGPSFPLIESSLQDVRQLLGIPAEERLVLIAFGGVPLASLPWEQMESCEGFHFLVAESSLEPTFRRVHSVEDIKLSFGEVMRQVDVVMTKPGYATLTAAVHYGIPLVYVQRHNFVDEQPLVDYAHTYGRAVELSRDKFESGSWEKALESVLALPISQLSPPKPEPHVVAGVLKEYLKR